MARAVERMEKAKREGRRPIAILGFSNTGKSTFVGALADELKRTSRLGAFKTPSASDPEANQIISLSKIVASGRFPPATEKDRVHVFNFTVGTADYCLIDLAGEFFDSQDPTQAHDRIYEREAASTKRDQDLMSLLGGCVGFIYLVNLNVPTDSGVDTVVGNFLHLRARAGSKDSPFVLGLTQADQRFGSPRPPVFGRGSPYQTLIREWPNLFENVRQHALHWKVAWMSVGRVLPDATNTNADEPQFAAHTRGYWGVVDSFAFAAHRPAAGVMGTAGLRRLTAASWWW